MCDFNVIFVGIRVWFDGMPYSCNDFIVCELFWGHFGCVLLVVTTKYVFFMMT